MKIKMDLVDKCKISSIPVGEICLLADLSPVMRVEIPDLGDVNGQIWILQIADGRIAQTSAVSLVRPMGKSAVEIKGSTAEEIRKILAAEKETAEKAIIDKAVETASA